MQLLKKSFTKQNKTGAKNSAIFVIVQDRDSSNGAYFVTGNFAVGSFAVGNFAVGKIVRKEIWT